MRHGVWRLSSDPRARQRPPPRPPLRGVRLRRLRLGQRLVVQRRRGGPQDIAWERRRHGGGRWLCAGPTISAQTPCSICQSLVDDNFGWGRCFEQLGWPRRSLEHRPGVLGRWCSDARPNHDAQGRDLDSIRPERAPHVGGSSCFPCLAEKPMLRWFRPSLGRS